MTGINPSHHTFGHIGESMGIHSLTITEVAQDVFELRARCGKTGVVTVREDIDMSSGGAWCNRCAFA